MPFLLGRTSAVVIIFYFADCLPGSMGLSYATSLLHLLISLLPLLYIFSYGECSDRLQVVFIGRSEVAQSCATLCDPTDCIAYQAPLSMEFSSQEYWSGFPFLSPVDLPYPGIKLRSPSFQVDALPSKPPGKPKGEKLSQVPCKQLVFCCAHLGMSSGIFLLYHLGYMS